MPAEPGAKRNPAFPTAVGEVMGPHAFCCRTRDSCGTAAGLMWTHDCGMLPVLDRYGAPVAAVTDRDICMAAYTRGTSVWTLPVTAASSRHLWAVRPEDSLEFAETLMRMHRVRRVAVVDRGCNLVGVLSIADLARSALSAGTLDTPLDAARVASMLSDVFRPQTPRRSNETGGYAMNVGQLMTHNPRVCSMHDSLERAAQVMWEADCGAMPVVDDGGKAVGMVTDRDICMAAYTQGRPLWQLPVGLAASRAIFCAHEHDSIEAVEAMMQAHRIRRVPVIDADGHPVGIVSLNDLARRAHTGHRNGSLGADAVVKTFAAICSPDGHAAAAE